MKAIDVLDCILYMGASGEDFTRIEVPAEDDEWTPQNEEWWLNEIGGYPPTAIEKGIYLVYFPNDARDWLQTDMRHFMPDATVEVGDSVFYLYKLEE